MLGAPEPLGSPGKLLYGASGKANFGDIGFLTQISASRSLPTRCQRNLPLQCLAGAEGWTCFLQESGFEWLFTAATRQLGMNLSRNPLEFPSKRPFLEF